MLTYAKVPASALLENCNALGAQLCYWARCSLAIRFLVLVVKRCGTAGWAANHVPGAVVDWVGVELVAGGVVTVVAVRVQKGGGVKVGGVLHYGAYQARRRMAVLRQVDVDLRNR